MCLSTFKPSLSEVTWPDLSLSHTRPEGSISHRVKPIMINKRNHACRNTHRPFFILESTPYIYTYFLLFQIIDSSRHLKHGGRRGRWSDTADASYKLQHVSRMQRQHERRTWLHTILTFF